ncbi:MULTISPECIES: FAD-dependent oxidoreductase [Micrococcaceae]|uniref:FAD-dependent oxidoreductase n=1 Tax=Micrococcaceae TaxID=1268 RepID=UPI0016224387|nr:MULTISPECIES: FAD-dependent oxidoreductase [Micrococcaceae]MBB5750370.1 2-polyprenyl-6-methoxyphenol hydroxylase-like FAD-dependent oxidoreductase [Micrococcus sp. TA1]HRO29763.1 FAD-dependent oxidoreductase [Citricoccus sp.]HRO94165.1 FAD-dependent oxidoreductase [Citricoccus sp.]
MNTATIVGAGIAGLATATALHHAGWHVTVLERERSLSTAGTQLGIWPGAWRTLVSLGVAERLAPAAGSGPAGPGVGTSGEATDGISSGVSGGRILRPDGTVLAQVSLRGRGPGLHLVPRMTLLEALLAGLPKGTVRFSTPVGPDAPAPPADVVVGADGINSAVRAAAFPAARVSDAGLVAFRGVAPVPSGGADETWGAELLFGTSPFPGGGTNWYACLPLERAGSRAQDPLTVLRREFAGWHAGVQRVLDAVSPASIDRRRLKWSQPMPSYVSAGTVLVGDAAHAMLPHLGRGGGEALTDGLVLAESLVDAQTVAEGLRRYDTARRAPTQRIVRASALMARVSNRTRHTGARDLAVRALGTLVTLRG